MLGQRYYIMIQPILYRSFEEKHKLEAELLSRLSNKERLKRSKALMDLFYNMNPANHSPRKKTKNVSQSSKRK